MQPVHGYDVRRELESWHADEWANVAPGSVYHALRRLAQEGLLAEVATERVRGRPARTTYRVTEKGEHEFNDLLRRYWWGYEAPTDPFLTAFVFTPALGPREAAAALRNRARLLRGEADSLRFVLASEWMNQSNPVQVGWMLELRLARLDAEISWCERTAGRVEVLDSDTTRTSQV
jgi:DNA-binding PadR family transcriptional regulator